MEALGQRLRDTRRAVGRSQEDVARAARLPQSHLSRIERGLDARASVLDRVARALNVRLTLEPLFADSRRGQPYEDEIANRLYLMGRLASKRITGQSLGELRRLFEKMRARQGDFEYYRRWLSIIDDGPNAVASVLRDPTEFGRYMRAVGTMRPFVSKHERDMFYAPSLTRELLLAVDVLERRNADD
jgi:transcriptional regulator with XRE-family HTH domain